MTTEETGIRGEMCGDDLFDADLLYKLDFSRTYSTLKNGLCSSKAGDGLVMRPLRIGDYDRGAFWLYITDETSAGFDRYLAFIFTSISLRVRCTCLGIAGHIINSKWAGGLVKLGKDVAFLPDLTGGSRVRS